jgi:hypothetical protein
MAALITPTSTALFGIAGGADTYEWQSLSVSTKFDKKEVMNNQGETIGWAFYGKMAEHSIELAGKIDVDTFAVGGDATAPTGITAAVGGTAFCIDELTISRTNDDFVKSTMKVSEYFIED